MAVFTIAVRYETEAVCVTPLRTGGQDGDPETVLRDAQGRAFLQGSSLAGALRGWLEDQGKKDVAKELFGSQKGSGRLMVSDALFGADDVQATRPRLRINGKTGTADNGGKFDTAHMVAGSRLHFTLTWLGREKNSDETDTIERMLGALHRGEIRLGAQKTNGFGHVRLTVKKRVFQMQNAADREAWLADEAGGIVLTLPESGVLSSRVKFLVTGRTDGILVKASAQEKRTKGKEGTVSVTVNLKENGRSVLPGSSVKGAVRARAESIARLLGLPDAVTEEWFGRGSNRDDNGLPGQVVFNDVMLSEQKKEIRRIRINRFTGGVIRQGMMTEEPVSSDVDLTITAPAENPVGCGLLLYALRDLGLGLYHLGSGGSIGRGYLVVRKIEIEAPSGKKAALVFRENQPVSIEDPDGLLNVWMQAVRREQQ